MSQLVARGIVEHEEGVWIGLSNDSYQPDIAIGSGGLKTIHHSPPKWWWNSPYNQIEPPAAKKADPAWARLGVALHVCLLEGMDVYDACYGLLPTLEQYPDALVNNDQLKEKCRDLGQPVGGDKEALIARIHNVNPDIPILQVIQNQWRADAGVREISPADDRRIRLLHRMAMASADSFELPGGEVTTLRQALTGGLSEVSVFWVDENGIRQRARFDKLKPRVTVDLKSFSSWSEDHDFDIGLLREAKQRMYPLQTVHYDEGRRQLRRLVMEGKVFGGTDEQRAMLDEIAASDVWGWMWVYAVTTGAPLMKGVRFDLGSLVAEEWRRKRENALSRFIFYRDFFGGYDRMWFDPVGIIEPDDDAWLTA
jgi:hypothetical protein